MLVDWANRRLSGFPLGATGGSAIAVTLTGVALASTTNATQSAGGMNFASILDNAEKTGLTADKAAGQLATGDLQNIQQYTSAAAKAELTVDLVVAIRNRAIDAYQEIMRMSV